jgi:DNA (cytosine-5)-methyltransferase 1
MKATTKKITEHKFPYDWELSDGYPAEGITQHNKTVFSCFACGGGSTMGYKLAGYNVLGCNEIDPKMMTAYIENHKPKYSYLEPIQTFKLRKDLPEELYNLDILDGSPPCSSFSMAGNRSKDWGKEKKFREGQAKQILDTLFFDFIDLAAELKPKIVIAENVKGLIQGDANKYVNEIRKAFDKAGYYFQLFLFDASDMGVPQKRERVFIICMRKDLAGPFLYQANLFEQLPKIELKFNFKKILFFEIEDFNAKRKKLTPAIQKVYDKRLPNDKSLGETTQRHGKRKFFDYMINDPLKVSYTITASTDKNIYKNGYLTKNELIKIGSYPLDYNFLNNKPKYLIGMSVPPVMTAQIANNIYNQWLKFL